MKGLFIQEFKTLFKSPASISLLIIPIVLMIGLGYLLPSGWIIPSSITIGIVASVLLYFGGSIEEVKRTSFIKSVSLTRLNKFTFLSVKILFSTLIAFFSILWILFFGWFFTEVVDFLAHDFTNLIPEESTDGIASVAITIPFLVEWDNIHWVALFYSGIVTIVVSISLAFVFVTLSKSSLSFYLMSFGYLIAMILFGGVVMPEFLISEENDWFKSLYYIVPNFYTNNLVVSSFNNSLAPGVNSLADRLDMFVDNPIFNAPVTPSADDVSTIENLFKTFRPEYTFIDDGGSMAELDRWYDDLKVAGTNSEYLDWAYSVLSIPAMYDFDTWSDYLIVVTNNIGHNMDLLGLIANILNNVTGSSDFTAESISQSILGHDDLVSGFLWRILGYGLPPIPGIFSGIDPILQTLTTSGPKDFVDSVHNLTNTLRGAFRYHSMFDFTDTKAILDTFVPWVETGLFVMISVMFFRWS